MFSEVEDGYVAFIVNDMSYKINRLGSVGEVAESLDIIDDGGDEVSFSVPDGNIGISVELGFQDFKGRKCVGLGAMGVGEFA